MQSGIATEYEYYLWIAYRIAKGLLTLEAVCDDSSELGNYYDAETSSRSLEKSGERTVGGFKDGIGNTAKIIKSEGEFVAVGADYSSCGADFPAGYMDGSTEPICVDESACAVIVLRPGFTI